jgi:transcriptional regulator with XRE-family HTH domain
MLLSQNLKHLRKAKGLTQSNLAEKLGLKRGILGAYEEGRAEPRLQTLQHIAHYFAVSLDDLLLNDLSTGKAVVDFKGTSLRILPIITDRNTGNERASIVPVKAAAGYLQGYGDVEYIEALNHFALPFAELPADRTFRLFQINGDSMLPLPSGAYIISEYIQDWQHIRFGERYVLLTLNDGIVFKRVYALPEGGGYELVSDNRTYKPYRIQHEDILEVWKARGVVSFDIDSIGNGHGNDVKELAAAINRLELKLEEFKNPGTT